MSKIVTKINDHSPQPKNNSGRYNERSMVKICQEDELKLYSKPPWGDIAPPPPLPVIEIMKNLGFKQHEIKELGTGRKYNNIWAHI